MWALAVNLPLMIGDKVPYNNEKWECFLVLLDILQVCTARKSLLQLWQGIWELLLRQKMHAVNLSHMQHWSIINTWCMRMEAKNSFLKQEWDRGAIFKEEWTPTEIIRTIFST